jgi:hypothetical protein
MMLDLVRRLATNNPLTQPPNPVVNGLEDLVSIFLPRFLMSWKVEGNLFSFHQSANVLRQVQRICCMYLEHRFDSVLL